MKKLADISAFERLQSNAHSGMGLSSEMAVFNSAVFADQLFEKVNKAIEHSPGHIESSANLCGLISLDFLLMLDTHRINLGKYSLLDIQDLVFEEVSPVLSRVKKTYDLDSSEFNTQEMLTNILRSVANETALGIAKIEMGKKMGLPPSQTTPYIKGEHQKILDSLPSRFPRFDSINDLKNDCLVAVGRGDEVRKRRPVSLEPIADDDPFWGD